ncbi:MAG: type II toxin-antitoxin system VapC family toxin [Candidatus Omnitrophica bacterium]|nr:type II toxin-antitoxin system VapC family toxin [Candidatus Omnitrophota bacterium]
MIILDTCALLWLAADQKELSLKARAAITKHAQTLYISAISAFELAVKQRRKKLILPLPAGEWYAKTLDHHGIQEIVVSSDILVRSVNLPSLHNDPCDRIIIATALHHRCPILTCDSWISRYPIVTTIW